MSYLVLGDLPFNVSGLSWHAELVAQGLEKLGFNVERRQLHDFRGKVKAIQEGAKTVVGIGVWFNAEHVIQPARELGAFPVPYFVSNGRIEGKQDLFNSLSLMFTPSRYCKRVYVADGVKADIIQVLPLGIPLDIFKPVDNLEVRHLKGELCGHVEKQMMLNIGATSVAKGGREIIEALPKVVKEYKNFKMVFKVQPSQVLSKPEAKEIERDKKRAHGLGLDPYITWLEDRYEEMYSAKLLNLFNACDIYVAPSRQDGFGISFIQALACGKPVITQRGTAPEEIIIDGVTGFFVKSAQYCYYEWDGKVWLDYSVDKPKTHRPPYATIADPDDLADKMLMLLTDDDFRMKMGEEARIYAEENYDITVMARRMVEKINAHRG